MISFNKFRHIQKQIFFSKTDIPFLYPQRISSDTNSSSIIDSIITICRHVFGKKPTSAEQLPRSTLHAVYKVLVNKESYCFRINLGSAYYSEYAFAIEQQIEKLFQKYKIPSTTIVTTDLTRGVVPFDYQIRAYAPGFSLYELVHTKKESEKHFYQLGHVLSRLHTISTAYYGPFNLALSRKYSYNGIFRQWRDYLYLNLPTHLEYCRINSIIDSNIYKECEALFRLYHTLADPPRSSILHGDIANHNVIYHNGTVKALIDWEDVISGDPIFDLAYYGTGAYMKTHWLEPFMQGYFRSRTQEKNVEFWQRYWLYFIRISLSKAVLRHRSNDITKVGSPELSERIVHGIRSLNKVNFL